MTEQSIPPRRAESLPVRAAWAVVNSAQFAFTLVFTSTGIVVALALRLLLRSADVPLRMGAWMWGPVLMTGAGAKLVVEGADAIDWSKPHVLVATHQSIIDICALFRATPVPLRFMLKQEMTRVPFVGWYARAMGMCFIERDGTRASMVRSLRAATAIVNAGQTICIFPEGTRSREGAMGPFKAGAFQVALAAGVPVIPVAMSGSGAIVPPYSFRVRPGTIRVRFGAPIELPQIAPAEAREQLARQAREAVVDMMEAA